MKKINNIFNTANKSLFVIGDTSRRSTPDSSGQRRILLSSCRGPISPLARGVPARAGCRKFGVWFAALVALLVATPSFAEPTELDKKTVASKAYVDTKQNKIPAAEEDYQSVLVDTDMDGEVGKMQIVTQDYLDDEGLILADVPDTIPTSAAVYYELDTYWQPQITTGLVTFEDGAVQGGTSGEDDLTVRALVATNANGTALNGNTIGIVDQDTFGDSDKGALRHYNVDYEMDNFVPTVRAVATALQNTQSILGPAWTSTTGTSEMASTGGQTIDLRTTRGEVGQRYITAGGSQPLTQKTGADNVILYINGTKTLAQYQTSNFGATGSSATENQNYIKGALVSLELLKDVYGELNAKITNALPAGTAGNVVTYSGTSGTVSARGVYNNPSSEYFDNPNINENELITVNAAAAIVDYVDARAPEITCAGVEPSTNECWLWTIPTYTTTTRPLPRGDGRTDVWVTGFTAKVSCINAIRENTSITGLIEARDAVENAPTRVATGLSSTAASNLVSTLVSGGCTAEIRNP